MAGLEHVNGYKSGSVDAERGKDKRGDRAETGGAASAGEARAMGEHRGLVQEFKGRYELGLRQR